MAILRRADSREKDLPPLTVDLNAPARKNSPFALRLYLVKTFSAVERADTDGARWAAAHWFARCPGLVPRRFENPKVRKCLAQEQAFRGRAGVRQWLKESVFPQAVLHVASDFRHLRRIRLGRQWLADEQGRIVPRKPENLPVSFFAQWLRQTVRSQAEAIILGGDIARSATEPSETPAKSRPLLRHLSRGLSARDRKLVEFLHQSHAEIAAALDCSVGASRQARYRLRQKTQKKTKA